MRDGVVNSVFGWRMSVGDWVFMCGCHGGLAVWVCTVSTVCDEDRRRWLKRRRWIILLDKPTFDCRKARHNPSLEQTISSIILFFDVLRRLHIRRPSFLECVYGGETCLYSYGEADDAEVLPLSPSNYPVQICSVPSLSRSVIVYLLCIPPETTTHEGHVWHGRGGAHNAYDGW